MALKRDVVVQNAEKLVARGKIEAAIKEYLRLIEENPNDTNILNRIGDLYVRINRILEATKYFYDIAKFWADDGFYLKAIAILKKINKLDPSILEVYDRLGELYAKQGMNSEAASHYQYLADFLSRQGKSADALEIYRKITAMDPDNIALRGRLAELLNAAGDMKNAVAEYQTIGKMLVTNGHIQEAIQVYHRALKMDPRNVGMIKDLAASLLAEGRHADVVRLLESAAAVQLNDPQVFQILAQAHLGAGQASLALDAVSMGLRKTPTSDPLLEIKGDILMMMGRSEDGITAYLGAADLAMNEHNPGRALSLCAKILRKDPVSIATLDKMVDIHTQLHQEGYIIQTLAQLAEAYLHFNRSAEAVAALERLIRLEPENVQHREKLAFIRQRMGQRVSLQHVVRPEVAAEEVEALPGGIGEPTPGPPVVGRPPDDEILLEQDLPPALRDYMGEHMVEIEVFSKYDLTEKAVQGLKSVLERVPHYVPALEKLLQIYLEDNRLEEALKIGNHLLALYARRGLGDRADNLREQMLHQGIAPEELSDVPVAPPAPPVRESRMLHRPTPIVTPPTAQAARMAGPTPAAVPEEPVLQLDLTAEETDLDLEFAALGMPEESGPLHPPAAMEPKKAFAREINSPPFTDTEPEFPPEIHAAPVTEPRLKAFADTNPALIIPAPAPPPLAAPVPPIQGTIAPPRPSLIIPNPVIAPPPQAAAPPTTPVARKEVPPSAPLASAKPRTETAVPEFDILKSDKRAARIPLLPSAGADRPAAPTPPSGKAPSPTPRTKPGTRVTKSLRDLDRLAESLLEKPKKKAALPPTAAAPSAGPLSDFLGVNEEMGSLLQKSIPMSPEPPVEMLGELDFYLEQEIADEAKKALADLQDRFPGHPEVLSRAARFEALSRKAGVPALAPGPGVKDGESLFSEEEEFFDLASELEEDLGDVKKEMVLPVLTEPTLEEVFEQFKQGVRQTLSPEDYDTHYNLGIAYKEMGLVDEAISEFQIACKDPERLIDCCSMLGLCFLEKGMPQLAEKWYRKAMESPELSEDEQLGILYDLGSLFMQSGDLENAYKSFLDIYGIRNDYRDVVERLKELERAKKTAN